MEAVDKAGDADKLVARYLTLRELFSSSYFPLWQDIFACHLNPYFLRTHNLLPDGFQNMNISIGRELGNELNVPQIDINFSSTQENGGFLVAINREGSKLLNFNMWEDKANPGNNYYRYTLAEKSEMNQNEINELIFWSLLLINHKLNAS